MGEAFPQGTTEEDDLEVHRAEAAVGDGDPAARVADAALPLAGAPDEEERDDAAEECNLLRRVDDAVGGATAALTVLALAVEDEVAEEEDEGDDEEEVGVVEVAAGAVGEVLGAERGFQDEEVEVNLRRGGREAGEGVGEGGRRGGFFGFV